MDRNDDGIGQGFCRIDLPGKLLVVLLHRFGAEARACGTKIGNMKRRAGRQRDIVGMLGIGQQCHGKAVLLDDADVVVILFALVGTDGHGIQGLGKGGCSRIACRALVQHMIVGQADDVKAQLHQIIPQILGGIEAGIARVTEGCSRHGGLLVDEGKISLGNDGGNVTKSGLEIILPSPRHCTVSSVDVDAGMHQIVPNRRKGNTDHLVGEAFHYGRSGIRLGPRQSLHPRNRLRRNGGCRHRGTGG